MPVTEVTDFPMPDEYYVVARADSEALTWLREQKIDWYLVKQQYIGNRRMGFYDILDKDAAIIFKLKFG
jgi:hypothetical protein